VWFFSKIAVIERSIFHHRRQKCWPAVIATFGDAPAALDRSVGSVIDLRRDCLKASCAPCFLRGYTIRVAYALAARPVSGDLWLRMTAFGVIGPAEILPPALNKTTSIVLTT
jgi:hypothetical protein